MKLARYWTREPGEAVGPDGRRVRVVSRGWSEESIDQAAAVARDLATRVAQRIALGAMPERQYSYGDRPLPEPVLREFADGAGRRAVITRNMYGALVLNAQNLMFIDVDRDSPAIMNEFQSASQANNLAVRAYKTAAGYRLLITDRVYQPGSPESEAVLGQFGADPLYVRLCRMQQSFRARLTPKPWRCGSVQPPVQFPFSTPRDEAQFNQWEAQYRAAASRYATCRYLASFGGVRIAPEFEELVWEHDQETKANSQHALA